MTIAKTQRTNDGTAAAARRAGSARRWLLLAGLVGTFAGCNGLFGNITPGTDEGLGGADGSVGGSDAETDASGGGTESSGGAHGSGGTAAADGGTGGGPDGDGGADGSGGAEGSGGSEGSGGAEASGGTEASGGAEASGGSEGSGGAEASGGSEGSGGAEASGGSEGSGGSGPEPSVIGTVGEACAPNGALGCAGYNQRYQLECEAGEWESFGQCTSSERCDTRESNVGSCEPIVAACVAAAPGDEVACADDLPQACGVDRVTLEDGQACEGLTGCLDGECEPVLVECIGHSEGDAVCSLDGNEAFECGENLVTKEGAETCSTWCSQGACAAEPPSCVGLANTCGSGGTDDCCLSPLVTGGTFNRGAGTGNPATVSTFRLDKYEVTVGRFRKFKAAWDGGWRPAAGSGKHAHLNGGLGLAATTGGGYEPGWDTAWAINVDASDAARGVPDGIYPTWTSSAGANETRPINYVNRYEGYAFCIWDGGFLPSEAEWEYAAAGGGQERTYPWGSATPLASLAAYECRGSGDEGASCNGADILVVGSIPAGDGRYGQSNLAGNLWEWHLDGFGSFSNPCDNCANVSASAAFGGIRGAGWDSGPSSLAAAARLSYTPTVRDLSIGVRCARP